MLPLKEEHDEEQEAFLETRSHHRREEPAAKVPQSRSTAFYLRLLLELAMAVTIVIFLARPMLASSQDAKVKSTPVPQFPKKTYTFLEDSTYLNEDMFASKEATTRTLHNWLPLSAAARGYISVPDYASYPGLLEPYTIAVNLTNDGPGYMMSVFHQLHCLSYLVQNFQAGYGGVKLEKEVAHHSAHCFDYIRQSIMCAGDTSLEGKTEAGPGWGSKHECVDYDAVLEWANKHGAKPFRGNMPDDAVL